MTRDVYERTRPLGEIDELPDGRLLVYPYDPPEDEYEGAEVRPDPDGPRLIDLTARRAAKAAPEPEPVTTEPSEEDKVLQAFLDLGIDPDVPVKAKSVEFSAGVEDYRQAQWLSHRMRGQWRFDHGHGSKGQWHVFRSPGIWFPDKTKTVMHQTAVLAQKALDREGQVPEPEQKRLASLLQVPMQERALKALSSFPEYSTTGEDWDQQPNLLGVANGVIDLNLGTVRPGEPSDLVTKTSPVGFSADSTCPTIDAFMTDVFRDRDGNEQRDLVEYILQVFGAALFGHTQPQQFWVFIGPGGAGKGTLVRLLMYVLGGEGQYATAPTSTLYTEQRFAPSSDKPRADLIALKGKRVAYISEPKPPFDDLLLFNHTGGDTITARTLFSGIVQEWEPTHTIIFSTNVAIPIRQTGVNMRRRLRVVPFVQSFAAHPDTELKGKLEAEAEGFLAKLVTYAKRYAEDPSVLDLDRAPAVVRDATKAYIEANDPLARFTTEHVEFGKGTVSGSNPPVAYKASTVETHEAYLAWFKTTEQEGEPLTQTSFVTTFLEAHQHNVTKDRDKTPSKTMTFFGMRLIRLDVLDFEGIRATR